MKELIGLVRLGALTVLSVALYGAHRQTQATHKSFHPSRQARSEGEWFCWALTGPSWHEK